MSFIRAILQLILACLGMSIAISYCTILSRWLSDSLDPDTGGLAFGFLFGMHLMLLLPFYILAKKWINENLKILLCGYFLAVLLVDIICVIYLKITLIGGLIFLLLMFSPLIGLVATTTQLISELISANFPYFKK